MREILFRGKRIDNGEWVEGQFAYTIPSKEPCIEVYFDSGISIRIRVDPYTVGQYTGLMDKNGQRIFEGDVVAFDRGEFVVTYFDCRMGFGFSGLNGRGVVSGFTMTDWEHLEVICNIHDNPELMGGAGGGV